MDKHIHSPSMVKYKGSIILGTRLFKTYKGKFNRTKYKPMGTVLCTYDGNKWSDQLQIEESSIWDCGYPSLAVRGDELLCAFYSGFHGMGCDIKLAVLTGDEDG